MVLKYKNARVIRKNKLDNGQIYVLHFGGPYLTRTSLCVQSGGILYAGFPPSGAIMTKIVVYVLCSFYFLRVRQIGADSLKKGDVCSDGRSVCTSLAKCPSAIIEIRKGVFPVLCTIENSVVFICCTDGQQSTTTTPASDDGVKFIERSKISIAAKKCREYMEETCGSGHSSHNRKPIIKPGIVGGVESRPKQFPHMALVGYGTSRAYIKWACGGSLISERYVLSAAHCANSNLGDARWVRLGELDLDSNVEDAAPQDYLIISRIVHPEYKAPSVYNDVALFKLNRNVMFNEYIRPLCLHETANIPNTKLIATGWGATGYGEITSNVMMNVNLSLIDHHVCKTLYPINENLPNGVNEDKQLCAGYLDGGKDTCQGDSGGPLQYLNVRTTCSPEYNQVGIVSFGKGCAFRNSPGIYTKISYYVPWIESIVWT